MSVYLVGAGPGDPGLLTRRGAELLGAADVVVYDRLVDPSVLALCRPSATLLDVGKWPGDRSGADSTTLQDQINAVLIEQARAGRTVVRLKGGDPFLFGRGGEEAAALAAAGVAYSVVAGVPSAFAVPASAGVPVTYRGLAGAVTVVTGQTGVPDSDGAVDWEALAGLPGTLVVLMGVATRGEIAARLMAAGRQPDTAVVVIERGTTPSASSTRTTLGSLGELAVESPATIVIGPVAALDLTGDPGPLERWRVVVTRAPARAGSLSQALAAAGAQVLAVPVIETRDPHDRGAALGAAAAQVGLYDWVVFTSATAVERFIAQLADLRALAGVSLGAVGAATAQALGRAQLVADLVPERATAAGLAEAMPATSTGRVLFAKAAEARSDLPEGLAAKGWVVDQVEAYRTVAAPPPSGPMVELLADADAITFTSPSTVTAYLALRDARGRPLPVPPVVACIGPVTSAAAQEAGLKVSAQASTASAESLVEALVASRGAAGSAEHEATERGAGGGARP